jgi:hypothetical protein
LGSDVADLSVEEGVTAVLDRMAKLTKDDNGKFWDIFVEKWHNPHLESPNEYHGKEVPW